MGIGSFLICLKACLVVCQALIVHRQHSPSSFRSESPLETRTSLQGWSRHAEILYEREEETPQDIAWNDSPEQSDGTRTCNLSSPREWLESRPDGAYTVIRCDYRLHDGDSKDSWYVWGLEFHVQRLQASWEALQSDKETSMTVVQPTAAEAASTASRVLVKELLQRTGNEFTTTLSKSHVAALCIVMVTILWFPDTEHVGLVRVQGHVFTDGIPTNPYNYNPDPITALVALPYDTFEALPSRKDTIPEAKLSSWCRRRRPLEDRFKSEGIGEVLLVDVNGQTTTLLEGLTSNLFVVYPKRVVRTAERDVLPGFARQLVLDAAGRVGLAIDLDPVPLEDASLWQECFLTSAVRLIVPIDKVLVPGREGNRWSELWSRKDRAQAAQVWRELYQSILRQEYGSNDDQTGCS